MNKKHYQLFAVSILLGAPLLVMMADEALPVARDAATQATDTPAPPPPPAQDGPTPDPVDALPPSLPPPVVSAGAAGPQANAGFDAAPTLNPAGIDPVAVAASDPAASAPAVSQPAVSQPAANPGGGRTGDQMIEHSTKTQDR